MDNKAIDIKKDLAPDVITKADVKKYLCEKATDKEIDLFLITCKLHGLNPLKREAYLIKYGSSPAQTVVGYETYLKRAESTGQLDGWECHADDNKAWITIYRKDRQFPFKWTIDRKEFDKKVAMWNTMPRHMLKKTCISISFRICFPETLGGMPYTKEEMEGTGEGAKEYREIPPRTSEKVPEKPPEPRSPEKGTKVPPKGNPSPEQPDSPELPLEPDKPDFSLQDPEMLRGGIKSMMIQMYGDIDAYFILKKRTKGKCEKFDEIPEHQLAKIYEVILAEYNTPKEEK